MKAPGTRSRRTDGGGWVVQNRLDWDRPYGPFPDRQDGWAEVISRHVTSPLPVPAWVAGPTDLHRPDAIFRIYSFSKAMVTAAALTLVDEGKLDLEDPVSLHLPELDGLRVWQSEGPRPPARKPTVRDLMRHTSGLTYGAFGQSAVDQLYREAQVLDRDTDLKGMIRKLSRIPLEYDPGTRWLYSVSVDVLGRVVEVVSGQSLDVFLQARLFRPLDLKDTGFQVPADQSDRLAALLSGGGGPASLHYWVSPKHELVVVTMEQMLPYSFLLEWEIKPLVYGAVTD